LMSVIIIIRRKGVIFRKSLKFLKNSKKMALSVRSFNSKDSFV
jgi:hypothetical protein